jgi:predicted GNAT family acetyltransferase
MRYKHFLFVSAVAFIQYDKFDNILDYNETQVPPAFRGKGIAKILAKVNNDVCSVVSTVSVYKFNLC